MDKRYLIKAFNEERLEIQVIGSADNETSADLIGRVHLDVLQNDWDGFFIVDSAESKPSRSSDISCN
jgi:hypothetical protein